VARSQLKPSGINPYHHRATRFRHGRQLAKHAEPGLAAIADAVLAARREAISLLVPGHRLSSSATLLPQQSPAGDMAGWVDAWKEAIRLARERRAN